MKLSKEVKEAIGGLSAKEIQEIAEEQNAAWAPVDLLVEQEALESLTEGLSEDDAKALEKILGADADRVADRLSAIQSRIQEAEGLTDEQRKAALKNLEAAAEKLGVELPSLEAEESTEEPKKQKPAEKSEEGEEGDEKRKPEPKGKESEKDEPSTAEILDAQDDLDEYLDGLDGVPDAERKAVREALKPVIRKGELVGAETIKKAVDSRIEESKRAAERWKPGRQVAVGDTGTDLGGNRASESDQEKARKSRLAAL